MSTVEQPGRRRRDLFFSSLNLFFLFLLIAAAVWYRGGAGTLFLAAANPCITAVFILNLLSSLRLRTVAPSFAPECIPAAILAGIGLLIQIISPFGPGAEAETGMLFSCAMISGALILNPPFRRPVIVFLCSLLLLGILATAYGYIQTGTGILSSRFVNRNHYCALLGLIFPLSLGLALTGNRLLLRWGAGIGGAGILAGVWLTRSRGGLAALTAAAFIVCGGAIVTAKQREGKIPVFRTVAVIICLILLIFAVLPHPARYLESSALDELSIRTRLSIWKSGLEMFRDRKISGWGWQSFRFIYPRFKEPGVWYTVEHAHNEYLQVLAESGIIGLLGLAAAAAAAGILLLKKLGRTSDPLARGVILASLGSLVYLLVHSGFDFICRVPANAFTVVVLITLGLTIDLKSKGRAPHLPRFILLGAATAVAALIFIFLFLPQLRIFRARRLEKKGEAAFQAGGFRQAADTFGRAAEISPRSPGLHRQKAEALIELFPGSNHPERSYREIINALATELRLNPADAAPLEILSRFYAELGAERKAEVSLDRALELKPFNPYLMMKKARFLLRKGETVAGARLLRRTGATFPPLGSQCLDLILEHCRDYEILKISVPDTDYIRRELGHALKNRRMFEEAEKEYKKAVGLNPGDFRNWQALGNIRMIRDNFDGSRAAFREALRLKPENAWTWYRLGQLSEKEGDGDTALDFYRQAQRYDPDNTNYAKKILALIEKIRGPEAALSYLQTAAEKHPDWAWIHAARAQILLRENRIEPALTAVRTARNIDPDHRYYRKLEQQINRRREEGGENE